MNNKRCQLRLHFHVRPSRPPMLNRPKLPLHGVQAVPAQPTESAAVSLCASPRARSVLFRSVSVEATAQGPNKSDTVAPSCVVKPAKRTNGRTARHGRRTKIHSRKYCTSIQLADSCAYSYICAATESETNRVGNISVCCILLSSYTRV